MSSNFLRKLTTDFENRTEVNVRPKHATFWTWTTRPYPTEQGQSILQPEISTYYAHFRFECKLLKFPFHAFLHAQIDLLLWEQRYAKNNHGNLLFLLFVSKRCLLSRLHSVCQWRRKVFNMGGGGKPWYRPVYLGVIRGEGAQCISKLWCVGGGGLAPAAPIISTPMVCWSQWILNFLK